MDTQAQSEPVKAGISDLQGCELMQGAAVLNEDGTVSFMCASATIPDPENDVFLNIANDRLRITDLRKAECSGDPDPCYLGRILQTKP